MLALPALIFVCATPLRSQKPAAPVKPREPIPAPTEMPATAERHLGQTSFEVSGMVEVTLGNRTAGRITVTGWDRDVISARAVSQRGDEVVIMDRRAADSERVFLKADYADMESSEPATRVMDLPPVGDDGPIQIHLEVSLPRKAMIQLIRVMRSDVSVTNVETPLTIVGEKSSIILKRVGAVEVHTRSGNVEIQGASGLVEVTTATGAIRVHQANGGVRAVSIAGPIQVKCARGRVDVTNTNAPIDLYNVDGDVDAIASNSSVLLSSKLQENGRYYLKSMSGRVEMILDRNISGFNANLTSYRGTLESDFPLKTNQNRASREHNSTGERGLNQRLNGQFGKGGAQIMLDSFEGLVRLTRATAALPVMDCKELR
jgi:hypothetical protein